MNINANKNLTPQGMAELNAAINIERDIEAENLFISEHANAADLLYGKTGDDTLTQDEDEACSAYAQSQVELWQAGF